MNTEFFIKNENGDIINTIIATHEFVKNNYEFYEEVGSLSSDNVVEENDPMTLAVNGREWRDSELLRTDPLILLPDYPYKEGLTVYRQALRDWPSTSDFPEIRPTLVI